MPNPHYHTKDHSTLWLGKVKILALFNMYIKKQICIYFIVKKCVVPIGFFFILFRISSKCLKPSISSHSKPRTGHHWLLQCFFLITLCCKTKQSRSLVRAILFWFPSIYFLLSWIYFWLSFLYVDIWMENHQTNNSS